MIISCQMYVNMHKEPTMYLSWEKLTYKVGRTCHFSFVAAFSIASLYTVEAASKLP